MNTNIKVLLSSIIVGIAYAVYILLQPSCGDGFGCIAQGLGTIFGVGGIAIIFGILGFLTTKLDTSWGKRFIRAFSWLGISFVVILLLTILTLKWQQREWQKTHPQDTAPSIYIP